MQAIIEGFRKFRSVTFAHERALFEELATGQHPLALVVTCADSRVDLQHITWSQPGQLLFQRNAGNLVPRYGTGSDSVAATVELAMEVLSIPHIVVCGHSDCGAMKVLAAPSGTPQLPDIRRWLVHAEEAYEKAFGCKLHEPGAPDLDAVMRERLIRTNVLVQLQHITGYPSVATRLATGEVTLHGWFYDIGSGRIEAYDAQTESWRPLEDGPAPSIDSDPAALATPHRAPSAGAVARSSYTNAGDV